MRTTHVVLARSTVACWMILYVAILNVWHHVSASGVAVRGDSVAGEGRVVGVPMLHSWGKCTMPLMNINSDWMSNASSGLCIILHYIFTWVLYFTSWGVHSSFYSSIQPPTHPPTHPPSLMLRPFCMLEKEGTVFWVTSCHSGWICSPIWELESDHRMCN